MTNELNTTELSQKIAILLTQARQSVVTTVNTTMVLTYFQIGKMIVEEEQNGNQRADYGKQLIKELSKKLMVDFGKGFSERNLRQMRQFYLIYGKQSIDDQQIWQTVSAKSENNLQSLPKFPLSWSHYVRLMRISDPVERQFYEIESKHHNWSLRELNRQYDSALFTRLTLSKNKDEVLMLAKQGQQINEPKDIIKDPYVLEFLDLPVHSQYSESEVEQGLIDKLEHFLLELGNGFTFVARQKRISFDDQHFYIDLVFYNRILRCFVLIDLKIGRLKHQDIGQMQMYVNYYDREMRLDDENKTIGIILCQDKSQSVVEYTLPKDNQQIFASQYLTVLPSKETLLNLINNQ